ncbi:MAG: hypothetical protein ACRD0P_16640 [Stackebrandtia sp.]
MSRFTLLPGLRRVRFQSNHVQLGSDPDRAYLLELPDARFGSLLKRLDNWLDEATYLLAARGLGLTGTDARGLLDLLRSKGFVLDSDDLTEDGRPASRRPPLSREAWALALRRTRAPGPVLAARRLQRVFVNGTGKLSHDVAALLRTAGFGRVWCADEGRRGSATLVVLVNSSQPPALAARGHARLGLPYLSVAILDGSVHVGPMVVPGRTPCLRCVDLHYRDHLPAGHTGGETDILETTTAGLAAAWAATIVQQHLDGETCAATAATIQIRPSLEFRRRDWDFHPDCGCST